MTASGDEELSLADLGQKLSGLVSDMKSFERRHDPRRAAVPRQAKKRAGAKPGPLSPASSAHAHAQALVRNHDGPSSTATAKKSGAAARRKRAAPPVPVGVPAVRRHPVSHPVSHASPPAAGAAPKPRARPPPPPVPKRAKAAVPHAAAAPTAHAIDEEGSSLLMRAKMLCNAAESVSEALADNPMLQRARQQAAAEAPAAEPGDALAATHAAVDEADEAEAPPPRAAEPAARAAEAADDDDELRPVHVTSVQMPAVSVSIVAEANLPAGPDPLLARARALSAAANRAAVAESRREAVDNVHEAPAPCFGGVAGRGPLPGVGEEAGDSDDEDALASSWPTH